MNKKRRTICFQRGGNDSGEFTKSPNELYVGEKLFLGVWVRFGEISSI